MSLSRRLSRHRSGRVGIAVVSLALVGVSSLGAQTIGGSVYDYGSGGAGCAGSPQMWVQTSSSAATDGVITSWQLGNAFSAATLKVVRPSAGSSFDVVAEAGPDSSSGTHLVRIPVRQGDQVGVSIRPGDAVICPRTDASVTSGYLTGDPAPGAHAAYTPGTVEIPLTAQVEPDADQDGYGDETQDQCPTNGATAGPCPLPTVLGRTFAPDVSVPCTGTFLPTATLGRVVRAPSAGVITSWSHQAAASGSGTMRFKAFRPLGNNVYLAVGEDAPHPLAAGVLNTFPVRIPVAAGDVIGLHSTGMRCLSNVTSSVVKTASVPEDPAVGTPITTSGGNSRNLDLSAVLEPDVDNDGYGDVSQDRCPAQAGTAGACRDLTAPDTSFKKAPKKTVTISGKKATIALALVSSEPGSTFQCQLDKGDYKPCATSLKLRLKKGKHVLRARAVDAAGNVDPTPVVAKIKVKVKPPS